jgi:hypothetical protein
MAQKNRANMLTDIVSNIYNNLVNFITGQNAQDRLVNLLDSSPNILSDKNQPDGYVGTNSNNEILSVYYNQNDNRTTIISMQAIGLLYPHKFYQINDADSNTRLLQVCAQDAFVLQSFAIDMNTGEIGTYDITTDVFTPIVSSGNANITPITAAALLALPSFSTTTIYVVIDANSNTFKMAIQAETTSQLSQTGTIIDDVYSGTVQYDLSGNTFVSGTIYDGLNNIWNGSLPSDTTLGSGSRRNTFGQFVKRITIGDSSTGNIFESDVDNAEIGSGSNFNTFKGGSEDFIFGNNLIYTTIESNTVGDDYTNLTNYGFLYGNPYPSTIFFDGTDNYHIITEPANNRFKLTNLTTLAVSYIGGGGNASITPILAAALLALPSFSTTTIYVVTDANSNTFKMAIQAETTSQLGQTGTIVDDAYSGVVHYDLAANTFLNGTIYDGDGNIWNGVLPSTTTLGAGCLRNTFGQGASGVVLGTDCLNNIFERIASSNTLGNDSNFNTFQQGASNNSLGDSCNQNIFKEAAANNIIGDSCYANTFEQNTSANILGNGCFNNTFKQSVINFTFGDFLVNTTIEANIVGFDCTNLTNYGFLYGNLYASTIFQSGGNNYHRYFDVANDRIVITDLATPTTVTYIGGGLTNPMTTGGDIIYGGASGIPTRLANGSAGQILQSNGTTLAPSWVAASGGGDAYLANDQTFTGENTFDIPSGNDTPVTITKGGSNAALKVTKSSGSGDAIEVAQGSVSIDDETASTIAHFDGSKRIKSLATSTYPSLTELSYVKGVTSAIQTQLNSKVTFFASGTDGTASSGTTNTISHSQLITANTFALGNVIRINWRLRATGVLGTRETRVYFNTTNTLVGATLMATVSITSTLLFSNAQRFAAIKNATTNTEISTATTNLLTDYNNLSTAPTTLAIDWTANVYIIFACNVINAADSILVSMYSIEKL